uniref:Fn3_PAP domain-containing protein n=1 Tax=Heterorhabditis bacteriophora TaxID=37862 RepID=A0A1I7X0L2_HETBA
MAAIVAEHSIGRVWQEEGERNGEAFWFLNGTDPSLQIALRMTYTTRPSQDLKRVTIDSVLDVFCYQYSWVALYVKFSSGLP